MSWKLINNKLAKEFKLNSFTEIIEKLNILALVADKLNHHPDLEITNYNHIYFSLFTHDVNDVTEKDHLLSIEIDKIFN